MKKVVGILTVLLVIIGAVVIIVLAKNTPKNFSEEYRFPSATWNKMNFATFAFDIPDSYVGKPFAIYIEMVHSPIIQRDKMLVNLNIYSPGGDTRVSEHQVHFKNPEGKFKGDVIDNIFTMKQILRRNFVFSQSGKWKFEIEQRSELYDFTGLESMRLVFEEMR
ncbi:MAG: hypothetical protein LBH92_01635 [Bacteroidales bacterium]|jgi:gliding motility-associated lipoprotein GldH|nr:hypothetical protein [Bacteroidales bacterium]